VASAGLRALTWPHGEGSAEAATTWPGVYHERMPMILEREQFDAWLDGRMGADALKPASE
jgi:putative SOS response-associated peptidase YedK